MNLKQKYQILEKISEGSFGQVYKAQHKLTKEYVAIKIEPLNLHNTLKSEAKILQYLGEYSIKGIPLLKWFGTQDKYNFLVMPFLGISLHELVKNKKLFSLDIVQKIGLQVIEIIEKIHFYGFIHRDIKPHNLLLNNGIIYLVDFGFTKRFLTNNKHNELTKIKNIIGSTNFISLHVHKRLEPSRRDDIISIIYLLVYLFFSKLLWENKSEIDVILLKEELFNNNLLPICLNKLLYYSYELTYDQNPNYDYIKNLLSII